MPWWDDEDEIEAFEAALAAALADEDGPDYESPLRWRQVQDVDTRGRL